MIAEREIAGFVLPFTIGTLTATVPSNQFFISSSGPATASLFLVSASIFCLIHPHHRRWNEHILSLLLLIVSIGCGLFIGFSHDLLSISCDHNNSFTSEIAMRLCEPLRASIEKLPFKNITTNEIISALITGERSGISPKTISAFRESGASHILALSGLHLGIIYGIISWIFSFLGRSPHSNRIRVFLIIASCGLYTITTGASPSITRAFLFILIGEISRLYNRHTSTAQVLMSAVFIQLLFSPSSAKEIGFQLSYAAMAGIAFIFPWLKNLWPEGKGGIMKWIWISATMSISCQITTGPLVYFYFGTFPHHFLLTNLIAIPLTGGIIPLSLLTLVLSSIGICPTFMMWITESLVNMMTEAMEIIASM